uniref:non-specific serine/threonine protein kinase n=1 Tax=Populus alba TaxID=43335 RepID=A0A4V6A978_POPAL|nr:putative LRR receptor-like serine/threonine-protein kinase [Populus alba]
MDGGVNYAERIYLAFENQVFEWKQAEWKCPRLISQNRQKYFAEPFEILTIISMSYRSGLLPCSGIHECPKSYRSFHVNCGGPDITSGGILYKGDGNIESDAARIYYNQGSNWGFSNTGDFMDDNDEGPGYILHSNYWNEPLFSTARRAAISLTYYGYCLENGMYTVKLDFAEIQFTDDKLYKRVGKRYFDIYIQGKLEKPDFNIEEAANGSNKAYSIVFNASVTDTTLEIRLYWNGKGTTCIPKRGNYGPLISAITVCSGIKTPIVVGVVTSALLLVFLVMGVICWKFYFRDKFMRERDLKGLDLKTGSFTLRQLRAATNNFDSAGKIGEGGFGSVYKAQVLQKKGNLMEIVDPKLQSEFNKEEAERMIKLALLCTNASPSLRPAMSEVVSMLEGQTSIQEVTSDPSIYGDDLHSKHLKGHYQQVMDPSLNSTQDLFPRSDKSWTGNSSTSAHDLYPINPESISLNLSETSSLI